MTGPVDGSGEMGNPARRVPQGHGGESLETRLRSLAADPRYVRLVRQRSRLAWSFTAAMLVVYFGFILLVAFRPDLLAAQLGRGVTSVGIPIGLGVILTAILLTAVYVRIANRAFDPIMDRLREEYGA